MWVAFTDKDAADKWRLTNDNARVRTAGRRFFRAGYWLKLKTR
jgi:hypothetical protein